MKAIPSTPQSGKSIVDQITGALTAVLLTTAIGTFSFSTQGLAETAVLVPPPAILEPLNGGDQLETAVVAGGCFWGVQAVFHTSRESKAQYLVIQAAYQMRLNMKWSALAPPDMPKP